MNQLSYLNAFGDDLLFVLLIYSFQSEYQANWEFLIKNDAETGTLKNGRIILYYIVDGICS